MGGNRKIRGLWLGGLIGLIFSLLVPGGASAGQMATSPAGTQEVVGPQTVDSVVATVVLWGGIETPTTRIWRMSRQVVRETKRVLFNARLAGRQLSARAAEVIQWSRTRLDKIVQVAARRITQTQ